jgi:Uma2 family endonuclease
MATPAPAEPAAHARYTVDEYQALWDQGVLGPDDRVELLAGVIVAMPPPNPPHDSGVYRVHDAVRTALGRRAVVRAQLSLVLGRWSLPEPDLAVVDPPAERYDAAHPTTARLVVEVADSSLVQDRLSKGPLYAAHGIPEYWIVNLRDECVEVYDDPQAAAGRTARYASVRIARRGDRIAPATFPDAAVAVDDLLPGR